MEGIKLGVQVRGARAHLVEDGETGLRVESGDTQGGLAHTVKENLVELGFRTQSYLASALALPSALQLLHYR